MSVYTATKSGISQFVSTLLEENPCYNLHVVYPPSVNTQILAGNEDLYDVSNVDVQVVSNSTLERVAMDETFIFLSDVEKNHPSMIKPLQDHTFTHALQVAYHGNPANPPLVFFGGFPDNLSLWDKQLDVFKETHYCITICLPDLGANKRLKEFHVNEICVMIHDFMELLPLTEEEGVDMVLHDMAVYWMSNYMERYGSARINKLVLLDVGMFTHTPALHSYQQLLVDVCKAAKNNQPFAADIERLKEMMDELQFNYRFCTQAIAPWMGYLYEAPLQHLNISFPEVPFIFIYGNQKKEHFHTLSFLEQIEAREAPYAAWFEIDAGHWLMRENPGRCNKLIKDFIGDRLKQPVKKEYEDASVMMT